MQEIFQEKYKKLHAELRRQMNGATVDLADALSGKKIFSYGVSLPTIKSIVSMYTPDHYFAQYLYAKDIREMKLSAICIDDHTLVTKEQMLHWSNTFTTLEIAENCASFLFWKTSTAKEVAYQWLDESDDIFKLKAALIILSKRVKIGDKDITTEDIIKKTEKLLPFNNVIITRGISLMLESLYGKSEHNRNSITDFLKKQKYKNNPIAIDLLNEMRYW